MRSLRARAVQLTPFPLCSRLDAPTCASPGPARNAARISLSPVMHLCVGHCSTYGPIKKPPQHPEGTHLAMEGSERQRRRVPARCTHARLVVARVGGAAGGGMGGGSNAQVGAKFTLGAPEPRAQS